MIYAGFWRRALSQFIDLFFFFCLYLIFLNTLYQYSPTAALSGYLALLVLNFIYQITFHTRWGQTIGKMITKIKITKLNGTKIQYKEALKRSSIEILLSFLATYGVVLAYTSINDYNWTSLSFNQKGYLLAENNPTEAVYNILIQIWFWSELVVLLFNKKKRAPHDFIAGTVVIHTEK